MAPRVIIDGPVGLRNRRQNVKNSASDQAKIVGMLAKISSANGGKAEEWATPPLAGADGTCPLHLADAIWEFQEFWKTKRHFQNIDGVVDPDKNSWALLNMLAMGTTPAPPPPGPPTPFIKPVTQAANITLDGRVALERPTPMHPGEWVRKTQAVFDTISAVPLGRQVMLRTKKLFIEPRLDTDPEAGSGRPGGVEVITFTADNFIGATGAGRSAEEILLHEMIHAADGHFQRYEDVPGVALKYAKADFLTIIGTNVYSSSKRLAIRAGHDGYTLMIQPYLSSPSEHVRVFRRNYQLAFTHNRQLFEVFKAQPAAWNPFQLFTP